MDVLRKCFEEDSLERAFRQIKGVLDIRSVRLWVKWKIESHMKICYQAHDILAYLNFIFL